MRKVHCARAGGNGHTARRTTAVRTGTLSYSPRRRPDEDWTLPAAKRTTAFWLLTAIFALTWLVVFMPMVPFAVDLGISQFRAAMTISVIGFAGFVGRLAIGTISDHLGRVPTLGVRLLLQALAFLGLTVSTGLVRRQNNWDNERL
jgi:predicted MFS family arabinose efflux permease